jgi:CheY-like chemotaxis protein
VPVIAVTASGYDTERERARIAGFSDFITKPFVDLPAFLNRIVKYLQENSNWPHRMFILYAKQGKRHVIPLGMHQPQTGQRGGAVTFLGQVAQQFKISIDRGTKTLSVEALYWGVRCMILRLTKDATRMAATDAFLS